jgi:hypothetical protein
VSHILPSYQISNICQQYAEDPLPECNAHFAAKGGGGAARARRAATGASGGGYAPGTSATPGGRSPRGGGPAAAPPGRRGGGAGAGDGPIPGIAQEALDAVMRHPPDGHGGPTAPAGDLLDWLLQP